MIARAVPNVSEASRAISTRRNRNCFCITLDRTALYAALDQEAGDPGFREAFTGSFGFDAGKREYVDLVEAGIIDPTKVVALENAVSVASVLLLTEATMTELPEPQKERSLEPEMTM